MLFQRRSRAEHSYSISVLRFASETAARGSEQVEDGLAVEVGFDEGTGGDGIVQIKVWKFKGV